MKLTITNETRWATRDLRAFVSAGLRAEGVEGKGHWRVRICYLRGGRGSSGYAGYNSTRMCLRLPNPTGKTWHDVAARNWATLPDADKADLAHVLWHEVAHCRGIRHGDMHGGFNGNCHGGRRDAPAPAWAAALTIRVRAEKPAPSPGQRADARLDRLRTRVARLTTRHKRLTTLLTNARRNLKASERRQTVRLAACASQLAAPT